MERMFKKFFSITFFSLAVLVSTADIMADCSNCGSSSCGGQNNNVLPYLNFRSPGRDNVRKLVGTTSYAVYQYDMESFYGTFSITPQYEGSFRSKRIAECLFGCDLGTGTSGDCPTDCDDGRVINVTGSQVETRGNNDWMAENFYLPRDFQSTLEFKPRIQNIILDFQLYVSLDEWTKGLYFRLYGPVVNARYDLRFCENVAEEGSVGYEEGFVNNADGEDTAGNNAVPTSELLSSATSFFGGGSPNITGITAQNLQFARMCTDKITKTCFSDLRFELGWNFLLEEDYLFGLGVEFAAPTGRRPDACFLFEPQCGNGKHWELGGNVHGLWTMWRSEDEEKHCDFVLEADITHLFNAKQKRTFDLNGKPLSRYMLAEKLGTTRQGPGGDNGDQLTEDSNAGVEYQNELAPIANFSTQDVKVRASVQADLVAMFDFTVRGFSWDIGYNFWARSCEKIKFRDSDCDDFPEKTWAVKGDAHVVGWRNESGNETDVRLAATQSNATIHAGTNIAATTDLIPAILNPGIDTPILATTNDAAGDNDVNVIATNTFTGTAQTRSSVPAVFITQCDLNLDGARGRGISHKVFTHFNYTWIDREDWIPYLGVGASAEFGKQDSKSGCCPSTSTSTSTSSSSSCDSCIDCGLSKWAVWLKLGLSFN